MATDLIERCISLPAGVDLSGRQFELMQLNGAGEAISVALLAENAIGVLTNAPTADGTARVCVSGVTRVKTGEAIAINETIGNGADGAGTAPKAGKNPVNPNFVYGTALATSGGANEVISCLVNFESPTKVPA